MIKLEIIRREKEQILQNLMQKYLYEMSAYYGDKMNEKGNFEYKYLPLYFIDPDRQACFIYKDEDLIGFALVNRHSFTGDEIDHCLAEFTIFPSYRNGGNGMAAFNALISQMPGSWQLKYCIDNKPASQLWKKVQEKYNGAASVLNENEVAITFRRTN